MAPPAALPPLIDPQPRAAADAETSSSQAPAPAARGLAPLADALSSTAAEDRASAARELGLRGTDVQIVPVAQVFE